MVRFIANSLSLIRFFSNVLNGPIPEDGEYRIQPSSGSLTIAGYNEKLFLTDIEGEKKGIFMDRSTLERAVNILSILSESPVTVNLHQYSMTMSIYL